MCACDSNGASGGFDRRGRAQSGASIETLQAVGADGFRVDDAHLAEVGLVGERQRRALVVDDVTAVLDLVAGLQIEDAAPAALDILRGIGGGIFGDAVVLKGDGLVPMVAVERPWDMEDTRRRFAEAEARYRAISASAVPGSSG